MLSLSYRPLSSPPPVPTIRRFLRATRVIADVLERNITNFLTENDRIIANIDSLISGLEETHTLINRVGACETRGAGCEGEIGEGE